MIRKTKVLIVDDSDIILTLEKALLPSTAYDVILAHDGAEGLTRALQETPDVILLDVVMPKLSGFDTCKALRQNTKTKEIPIIMVTTKGDQKSIETGFACGCTDYLTKPIQANEFTAKVRKAVGRGHPVRV